MWIRHSFFKYMTGALLIVIFIYFLGKIDYFLYPFQKLIGTLFFPIVIAGLLYYILRPVVSLFSKSKYIPRSIAILVVYAVITGIVFLIFHFGGESISEQVNDMVKVIPENIEQMTGEAEEFMDEKNINMFSVDQFKQKGMTYLGNLTQSIGQNITDIVKALTSVATVLIIVPFILFYLLKEGDQLIPFLLKFIPENHNAEGKKILKDIDGTIAAYIIGQLTVALVNGVLMYLGYLFIGLDYAAFLALFVVMTAVVPFLGPILGILPAIVFGSIQSPEMVLYILIVLVVVQQLEGNLVSPLVLGNRLDIHPLTIILLLVVAGSIYGFIGILIAIPLYAVLKVTIKNLYRFYLLRQPIAKKH
ncbi:AI-2E family transporter [Oceanobacillus zhaokaii]|uniref:AI-2E family transporter n=1 Tax=Oceanobacillus zhaokaii TaxID=2052660 RepID=A0A345PCD4_9BACI|nr:AI-2E family transporter [Oceanobacillus zhaokaii]AXI07664.1 AI-2E family transporter [Oceanobacillus zhaokaii]